MIVIDKDTIISCPPYIWKECGLSDDDVKLINLKHLGYMFLFRVGVVSGTDQLTYMGVDSTNGVYSIAISGERNMQQRSLDDRVTDVSRRIEDKINFCFNDDESLYTFVVKKIFKVHLFNVKGFYTHISPSGTHTFEIYDRAKLVEELKTIKPDDPRITK